MALIIISMLPVMTFPLLLNAMQPSSPAETFVWLYPIYVIMAGWLAYLCYKNRPFLTWIILLVVMLTHGSIWFLTLY